jgi:uncharacterized repeat protein (TIGR01451 family)
MIRKLKACICFLLLAFAFTQHINAQSVIRPFNLAYSENLKGGTSMFGNTILASVTGNGNNSSPSLTQMNGTSNPNNGSGGIGFSQYGNDGSNMQYVDIDGVSSTVNSSSADLVLPSGSNTIKFARLYWGGRINNTVITSSPDTLRKIKIRKGTSGAYTTAIAPSINVDQYAISTTEKSYQSFVDVTAFVNSNGQGTYTIADLPVTPGTSSTGGKYGGWVIVVAYENTSQAYSSVRIFDGFTRVYDNGNISYLTINLDGLNVPSSPLTADEAVMGTVAWEGDANLSASSTNPAGDFIKVNGITVSNTVNPSTNFWNGSISKGGVFVTAKNPNYSNQMGIDIDEVNVGTGYNIAPNATSVTVQFGTEADMYFPSVFTFKIKVKDPLLVLDKSVSDSSGNGYVEPNELLTYTLSGSNQGQGGAINSIIVDTLPSNLQYIPGTLEVVSVPGVSTGFKTDAQDADQAFVGTSGGRTYIKFFIGLGATNSQGGQIAAGQSYSVRFKARATATPGSIVNTARIFSVNDMGNLFTDDGTATITQEQGPLPVKLSVFTAQLENNQSSILKWTTASEINNDHFEIERSEDGFHFYTRGTVTGRGSTSLPTSYTYNDEIDIKASTIYYRMKMVSTDGKESFSNIIPLKIKGAFNIEKITIYPNPFISDLKIYLNSNLEGSANIKILSLNGSMLINRSLDIKKGDNIITIDNLGNLQKGVYLIKLDSKTGTITQKIIKN